MDEAKQIVRDLCLEWDHLVKLSLEPTTRDDLESHIQMIVKSLQSLSQCTQLIPPPPSLIEAVDQGRHPEAWMKDELNRLQQANNLAMGRRDAFRRQLEMLREETEEVIAID